MRQLKIELSDLELAFESGNNMLSFYLDLETGEIISVSEEAQSLLTSITNSYSDEQTNVIDWERAFQEEGIADWLQEELQKAAQVEADTNNRFLAIPTESSREGYREMEDFIATVSDQRLQDRLSGAISGRGAFRNFKNMLLNYPAERQRWFQFKRERLHQHILDWLDEQGIEPIS